MTKAISKNNICKSASFLFYTNMRQIPGAKLSTQPKSVIRKKKKERRNLRAISHTEKDI